MLTGVNLSASLGLGWLGIDKVSSNGPDLTGISLVIGSIATLILAIAGAVKTFRPERPDPVETALVVWLQERLDEEKGRES